MKSILLTNAAIGFLLLGFHAHAQEQEHTTFLAMEHSRALNQDEWNLSFRYGLQSLLLLGQPVDPVFGELNLRKGLLDEGRDKPPFGVDVFASLMISQSDVQAGVLPMGVIGIKGQFLQGNGWIPTISLETFATLANKYRSIWILTPSATWDWRLGDFFGHLLVGGQLGIGTVPFPNQTTKGPYFYRSFLAAASVGFWRLESVVEYGGDFQAGYLAIGERCRLGQGLALFGGIRWDLVLKSGERMGDLSGFGGLSWTL